jgi:hypothetical protein
VGVSGSIPLARTILDAEAPDPAGRHLGGIHW